MESLEHEAIDGWGVDCAEVEIAEPDYAVELGDGWKRDQGEFRVDTS